MESKKKKKAVLYLIPLMHSASWFSGCYLLCSLNLTRSTVEGAEARRPCSSRPTERGQGTSRWFRARLEGDWKAARQAGGRLLSPDPETNKKQHLKSTNCYGQRQSNQQQQQPHAHKKKKKSFLTSNWTTISVLLRAILRIKQLLYHLCAFRKRFSIFSTFPRLSSSLGRMTLPARAWLTWPQSDGSVFMYHDQGKKTSKLKVGVCVCTNIRKALNLGLRFHLSKVKYRPSFQLQSVSIQLHKIQSLLRLHGKIKISKHNPHCVEQRLKEGSKNNMNLRLTNSSLERPKKKSFI